MKGMSANTFDAVVTDPPYGLEFMGQAWDALAHPKASSSFGGFARDRGDGRAGAPSFERVRRHLARIRLWHRLWALQAFRLLKPGGYAVAFGGCRTHHHLALALESVGFVIRDELQWQYAQGMPKSMDIAKAFARREDGESEDVAANWRGWGTGLKPAHEPILLCQKPLAGTYLDNLVSWSCGALNIDECRIPFENEAERRQVHSKNDHERFGSGPRGNHVYEPDPSPRTSYRAQARFPSNVLRTEPLGDGYDRYFVIPKASPTERNRGLDDLPIGRAQSYGSIDGGDFPFVAPDGRRRVRRGAAPQRNTHPTVKPIALMEHLLRLVVPPGGRVLDPFAGTAPTLIAAARLGLSAIGIDLDPAYVEIARRRLAAEASRRRGSASNDQSEPQ
jgi:site-specific DNA-methyltransferase (adenine-specific)